MDRFPLIRLALAAVVLCASGFVQAQTWAAPQLRYTASGSPYLVAPVNVASASTSGGAATLKATQALRFGNATIPLQLSRAVSASNLAAVAGVASRVIGPLAVAGLVYTGLQWAANDWLYEEPGDENAAYWWTHDPMHASYATCVTFAAQCTFETNTVEAANAYCAQNASTRHSCYVADATLTLVHAPSNKYKFTIGYTVTSTGLPGTYTNAFVYRQANGVTPEPSTVPATDAQVDASILAWLQANPTMADELLDQSKQQTAALATLLQLADPMQVSGPASADGGTATQTQVSTAGTTTIETATTLNLTYEGDTVTIGETKIETTTYPDSTVSTSTTVAAPPAGDAPPPVDPPNPCELNPEASGCAPLGVPAPADPMPEEERSVSFGTEMSAAGSCPADATFSVMGTSQSFSYASICSFASGIRPLVLAISWIGAIGWVFGVARGQA